MDLRSIRYFLVVAEELNITRAAEKLMMSQPPLSLQMKQLEQELGVTLFIRGKRRLELTEEGLLLQQRGRQILKLTEKTEGEIRAMQSGISGTLYLGMVEGRAPFFVSRWIAGFQEEYPEVTYSLWNGSTDDVLDRLNKGLIDLAIIMTPYDTERLEGIPIASHPWAALIPANHPLAKQSGTSIELRDLAAEPLFIPSRKSRRESIRKWFAEIDAEPIIRGTLANFMNAYALADRGVGISIFPRTMHLTEGPVICKEIIHPSRHSSYVLAWNKSKKLSLLGELFRDFVEDSLDPSMELPQDNL